MQEIILNRKSSDIISIHECQFNPHKIYAYYYNDIRVLVEYRKMYYWSNLTLARYEGYGGSTGFETPQEAIKIAISEGKQVYIFETQSELKEWIVKNH